MISIMILFKDIKLFWQSDSYYVLPVKHQGGGGKKRYISIKLFGILILTTLRMDYTETRRTQWGCSPPVCLFVCLYDIIFER